MQRIFEGSFVFNLLLSFGVFFFGSLSVGATSTLSSGEAPLCEIILNGIGDSRLAAAQSKIPGYEGSHRLDVTIATKVPLSGIQSEDPVVRAVATREAAFWEDVVQETTRALSLVPRLLDHVPSINFSFSPPPDRGLPESKQPHMVPTLGGATKGEPRTRIVFPNEAEVKLAGRYGQPFPKEMSETEKIARIKSVRGHEMEKFQFVVDGIKRRRLRDVTRLIS